MESGDKFKGTTTVGLVCRDGVVLGSERRASIGNLIASKRAKKVFEIEDTIGLTMAGSVGDAQKLVRAISAETKLYKLKREKPISVKATSTLMSNILGGGILPYYVQLVIGGVDKEGPSIYVLDPGGGCLEEKLASTGSGSPIAYGVLEDQYNEDLTVDEGADIAGRAIKAAMERDSASGNGIDITKITEDGFEYIDESDF
ncbi:archaeal proteasome endopeptidase complex subunit beta [Methanonatronarchaeum sp. AMET6-2]|uniref:archaeal proteasome endopeptidase complex subunit beta n=1 Tax=Methanonatronarchaeum sp. AMET6-2 TaxID=2933293 RepID=UPI0012216E67|nr:archaeal proteasome endopeptidase complex subunit beta [Methanonatronarchaeum sp. AMET6-2]RZN62960.1 MAG: archaeal proteasome endopeptidase complex subunit beta [Methanonatronarchaeia archaeon]UOY09680.1 archaeal proteasome endopeptidase complex subunit beta [Methanonatronarchaeum sp. AMET6-2]